MPRLAILLLCLSSAYTPAFAEVRYEIDVRRASVHSLAVTVEAECPRAECDFQMPVWNALYRIRDFSQYVSHFEAHRASGAALPVRLVNPSLWRVTAPPGERVKLRYQYLADAPGPFGSSATGQHVFLNPAQLLVYPVGQLAEPVSLAFHNVPSKWRLAIELPEQQGVFRARNYNELADAPVEIGAFTERQVQVAGKRLRIVVDADPEDYDIEVVQDLVRRIGNAAVTLMQDVPFESYTFFYHFRAGGGGGMEHANSTAIDARAPCHGDCNVASVTAHEFFHLWNVRRIRPQSLEPVDYTRENLTPSLWFSEGVTSTYGSYLLLQSGLDSVDTFLEHLQDQITQYERLPARLTQSAEESSLSAWLERYPSYLRPERSVSYYLKGELIGYLLDLVIRHESGNLRSLDDVMRRLNTEYAKRGKPFEETAALERLASEAAGHSLKDFFDRLVRRPEPVDWDHFLGYAGYRLKTVVTSLPTLAVRTGRAPEYGIVVDVDPDGPGERAGLETGDRIATVNGKALRDSLEDALQDARLQPGASVTLQVERRGRRRTVTATPDFVRQSAYQIEEKPHASNLERRLRQSWLRGAQPRTSQSSAARRGLPPPSR